ncbi:class I SAM-dependent methyltransferase [Ktedonosporobacter rubrisoli]|uniref:Class I SAM-dependent methyltransferase n=1 Tax=Ktedonosporobacter rubrisoli TaxID=2509675 RepID=A0A4P6JQB9_KTERU|nr:class I SAM-dependent methyltransferase [Ktedonosporobacter rubrisoli]QBD77608.1 class I SAM-dependent methyltransferase [Ktedonosporobacter rubrisoli]
MRKELHEENRLSWNEATKAHNSHKGDQAAFFRQGGSTLFEEEKLLLGDVKGRSVLHLQCNAGQDTLSIAQLGAHVTGVDISDTAIEFARRLSAESGIPATFQRMDVYDWFVEANRQSLRFDVVFCSYGAICWLSDLKAWATGIEALLKPGGRFVIVDFHPVAMMFDEKLKRAYPYFSNGNALTWEQGISDYVAFSEIRLPGTTYLEGVKDFKNPYHSHEFQWGTAEIITALLEANLALTSFKEYPYASQFKPYESMQRIGDRWLLPDNEPNIPLMYSITAAKPS